MFRIVRIHDEALPSSRKTVDLALQLLRSRSELPKRCGKLVRDAAHTPMVNGVRSILLIAQRRDDAVEGLALLRHVPGLRLCFAELLVGSKPTLHGRVGSALYERVREEAGALGARALVMEEASDDETVHPDSESRKNAVSRLRFYERYGARPLAGSKYSTRARLRGHPGHLLIIDALGSSRLPR